MKVLINYLSFKDVLYKYINYEYKPTSLWYSKVCKALNDYYYENCFSPKEGAEDFYKALGVRLSDKSMFYEYEDTEDIDVESKLYRLCSKSDILLDQYLPLYNKLKEDIKSVESRTISKFNDTPTSQGKYTADEYTSNITQITNSSDYDVNTQISYLKEKMLNLINKYCDQFEEFKIWTN